ncbi:MAG: aminomethyl-transferring glycine dehydrogenase subunit GcvPA [Acidobacteriota bacterium]|jgi:glycine dehydrogenase subunit 1
MTTTNDSHGPGRYQPLGPDDRAAMLETVGVGSVDELFASIPEALQYRGDLPLDRPLSEPELIRHLGELAGANAVAGDMLSFLGAGCYPHFVPTHVDALVQRQEFMTSYTPYQAEISQGTLQAIFEFQTLVAMLTGMDVCNASMYDGASAVAEAVLMARRLMRKGGRVLWSEGLHPAYREVAETYARYLDLDFELMPVDGAGRTMIPAIGEEVIAVVVQQPNFFGVMEDLRAAGATVAAAPAKFIVATAEPVAWALATPAGELGADIVAGELQSFGNGQNYGGPLVGFMASRAEYVRNLPGRLAGQTVDADGRRGFVLTLATREQHIRRAKATSNICTNTALCALATCIHLSTLGRTGIRELALQNLAKASYARDKLLAIEGVEAVFGGPVFNEFVVRLPLAASAAVDACAARGVIPGVPLGRFDDARANELLVCATEVHRRDDIDRLAAVLAEVCS